MKCPACGTEDAYVGFIGVDCPNNGCKHYQGSQTAVPTPAPPPASNPWGGGGGGIIFGGGGPWGSTISAPTLTIRISGIQPMQNNIKISFVAGGDPGHPDKDVEIYFDIGRGDQLCTLSHPNITFIPGVDADGVTVYTTNWLCLQDGVKPTDTYTLKPVINQHMKTYASLLHPIKVSTKPDGSFCVDNPVVSKTTLENGNDIYLVEAVFPEFHLVGVGHAMAIAHRSVNEQLNKKIGTQYADFLAKNFFFETSNCQLVTFI